MASKVLIGLLVVNQFSVVNSITSLLGSLVLGAVYNGITYMFKRVRKKNKKETPASPPPSPLLHQQSNIPRGLQLLSILNDSNNHQEGTRSTVFVPVLFAPPLPHPTSSPGQLLHDKTIFTINESSGLYEEPLTFAISDNESIATSCTMYSESSVESWVDLHQNENY